MKNSTFFFQAIFHILDSQESERCFGLMHKTLSQTQLSQLFHVIRHSRRPLYQRDGILLQVLLHTGLRVSELEQLSFHHTFHSNGQVKGVLELPSSIAKLGIPRSIPLNSVVIRALSYLRSYYQSIFFNIAPEAPLFQSPGHKRLSVCAIQRIVAYWRRQALLDIKATPHTFRHTFASHVLKATGNVRAVQMLLGHKRLSSTQVYTHIQLDDLKNAVEAIT